MTSEEFEAKAKHPSNLGSAVSAFQKIFDPSHHVEYIEEQQNRLEADSSESGDRPPAPPAVPPVGNTPISKT